MIISCGAYPRVGSSSLCEGWAGHFLPTGRETGHRPQTRLRAGAARASSWRRQGLTSSLFGMRVCQSHVNSRPVWVAADAACTIHIWHYRAGDLSGSSGPETKQIKLCHETCHVVLIVPKQCFWYVGSTSTVQENH